MEPGGGFCVSLRASGGCSSVKREIFRAAAEAQRIVDMVLGFHPDFAVAHQPERPSPETEAA
jgi:hypothetical protein